MGEWWGVWRWGKGERLAKMGSTVDQNLSVVQM